MTTLLVLHLFHCVPVGALAQPSVNLFNSLRAVSAQRPAPASPPPPPVQRHRSAPSAPVHRARGEPRSLSSRVEVIKDTPISIQSNLKNFYGAKTNRNNTAD